MAAFAFAFVVLAVVFGPAVILFMAGFGNDCS
jgi:hypothetical protein